MLGRAWILGVFVVGCIQSQATVCGDGQICPDGTVCKQVTNPSQELCVTPEQIAACDGKAPFDVCMLMGAAIARCYDGVCLTAGCGNGRTDPDEACDDGNSTIGDGCSSACQSNETCGNGIVDPVKIVGGIAQSNEQCDDTNLVGRDGCSSDCKLELPAWQQQITALPPGRFETEMAYDSARGRIVMFGGATRSSFFASPTLGDTWEWDGTGWIAVPTAVAPTARAGHVMGYDPVRRRVVMYGGASSLDLAGGAAFLADTWEYDGTSWTIRNPAHVPPPRSFAAAAYDTSRHKLVMFGGQDVTGTDLDETWEWDGTDWTQIVLTTKPAARSLHAMVYDPARGVVVMAGGGVQDTWEYDGTQWHDVTPALVANRTDQISDFGMAYDRITKQVVTYGGVTMAGPLTNNTWGWNGQVWTKLLAGSASTPSARERPTLATDPVRGNVILVGGFITTSCVPFNCYTTYNDTWRWNGSTWATVTVAAPTPRSNVASALDTWRGRFVIFGGETSGSSYSNETWEFDGGHWTKRTPVTSPPARHQMVMAFDSIRHQTVLFGGIDNVSMNPMSDTWTWDGTNWTKQLPATVPPPRYDESMAFDPVRGRIVMYGGDPVGTPTDTWEWDGTNWKLIPTGTSPGTALGYVATAAATWDPIRQRVVLTGGDNDLGETWEWDGATWTQKSSLQTPGSRNDDAIAWNAPRRTIELFGGGTSTEYNDLWEWDGTAWSPQFPPAPPPARSSHAMATSLDGGGVLVFGGLVTGPSWLGDLWRLRWTSNEPYELCTVDVDNDGDGLSGCADPDCWATCNPLCPPGATCDPSWPHCGDGTCSGVESCRMCPQDCGACTAVCGDTFCDAPETHASCPGDCP